MVARGKDTMMVHKDMVVVHKGMVVVRKDMDMDTVDKKWALAMMVG